MAVFCFGAGAAFWFGEDFSLTALPSLVLSLGVRVSVVLSFAGWEAISLARARIERPPPFAGTTLVEPPAAVATAGARVGPMRLRITYCWAIVQALVVIQ